MVNQNIVQQFIWSQFAAAFNSWPEEAKEAIRNLEINIVKDEGQLRLVAREIVPGNPHTGKAVSELFKIIIVPMAGIIGAFQCKVNIYK